MSAITVVDGDWERAAGVFQPVAMRAVIGSPCSGLMQLTQPSRGLDVPLLGRFFVPGGSDREILTDAAPGAINIAQPKLGLGQALLGRSGAPIKGCGLFLGYALAL